MNHKRSRFASKADLCAMFGVSPTTVKRWRSLGLITPHHFECRRSMYDVGAFRAVWETRRSGRPVKGSAVVLEALQGGARTSVEIASVVDMERENVAAHLDKLRKDGLVRIVKRWAVRFGERQGCRCHEWKVA